MSLITLKSATLYTAVRRTDGEQFDAGLPQALCRGDDVILGLPVRDEDSYLGNAGPGPGLRLEAGLQDVEPCSPILVWSNSTEKARTRFSRKVRTSLKLMRPMLQEPSTRITMSDMDEVLQVNSSSAERTQRNESL
ncbi:hypothetical protein EYF80_054975 [Liparis tanakae]|uniref:Uncharacterized protein n=1 Tax=Liparis tanakae TaxID=230148 RepID=A0A4Z2F1L5_9TELE|nr:hypothetical protein EYF80_054975 [Liparis tanakae]